MPERSIGMPYWRLSGYYFFHFAALGALVPFWGLYLQDRGFDPVAIGHLMAILMGTKIVAPYLWGSIADRTGRRLSIVRLAAILALVIFAGIFVVQGFWWVALVMVLFSFFWNAALPLMEAVTFNHLGQRVNRYAMVRVWGSVGFILAVGLLGWLLEDATTAIVPLAVLALFLGMWLSTLVIPEAASTKRSNGHVSVRGLLRRPEIIAFLAACACMQMSHGAYYAFYSIHLEANGYSSIMVGALWAWGVLVEVLVFMRMHWLLERFGPRRVLLVSCAIAVVRWLLIGELVGLLTVQIIAQAMHAATFGSFHASAIHLAHHYFPGRTQVRGQALYNSVSFGAGGAAGSVISGYLWGSAGAGVTFAVSSLAAAAGALIAWGWIDRQRRF